MSISTTRLRGRVLHWTTSLLLLWISVAACHAEGTVHNVSLNMDGLLHVTMHDQNVVALVCRVTHNSENRSSFFHLNGTILDGIHRLQTDHIIRVSSFNNCFVPPSQPGEECEELTLVLRATAAINNTRITCESRPRDRHSDMAPITSSETITVILRSPVTEDPSSLLPTATSSISTCTPSLVPTATPPSPPTVTEPEVDTSDSAENKSPDTVLPGGREKWYIGALAAETVLLIAALLMILFLLRCVCRKSRYTFEADAGRPESPIHLDSDDTKATYRPTCSTAPYTSEVREEGKEPRYTQCSHV